MTEKIVENSNIEREKKYAGGFLKEWLQDKVLIKKAKEMADFYLKAFAELKLQVPKDEVALIHFTDDLSLKAIEKEKRIMNVSDFFDVDKDWLKKIGCDVEGIKEKFGEPKSVVAIPLNSFEKWVNTLSWIKAVKQKAFDNAVIFTMPKHELILRNHRFTEKSFEEDTKNYMGTEVWANVAKARESTQKFSDESLAYKDFMPEVWIPQEVILKNYKIIKSPKE